MPALRSLRVKAHVARQVLEHTRVHIIAGNNLGLLRRKRERLDIRICLRLLSIHKHLTIRRHLGVHDHRRVYIAIVHDGANGRPLVVVFWVHPAVLPLQHILLQAAVDR